MRKKKRLILAHGLNRFSPFYFCGAREVEHYSSKTRGMNTVQKIYIHICKLNSTFETVSEIRGGG
jgi:hypothetical protein